MTPEEFVENRKRLNMTQTELAEALEPVREEVESDESVVIQRRLQDGGEDVDGGKTRAP